MIVYVKYCGGCNPSFDRSTFVNRLVKDTNCTITYEPTEKSDFQLYISGCSRNCATVQRSKNILLVNKESDYKNIIDKIL